MTAALEPADAIARLEAFWDFDGFFGLLRRGHFDASQVDQLEHLLRSVYVDDESVLPRRFVSLTWWIPTFMGWQLERVGEMGGDTEQLARDTVRLRNAIDDLLGVP